MTELADVRCGICNQTTGCECMSAVPVSTMMTRVELAADEWAEIRKHAIDKRTTTPKLIGSILRTYLSHEGEAA